MKYNIGIFGTFDVENYGDIFFPVVFKKAMEARGLDFNLYAFSPVVYKKHKLLGVDYDVYPVCELQEMHEKHNLDAIVIGGGAIVQYSKIPVKLPDENGFYDYKILDSWATPILFGLKNNIKILFNLPQIPHPFDLHLVDVTKSLFEQVSYLAVRDEISKTHILSLTSEGEKRLDVEVLPDSICCIPQYFDIEQLEKIRENVLSFQTPYAVMHFNAQLQKKDIPGLIETIRYFISEGLKVVLLPLGYTHNDDVILKQFNDENGKMCEIFEKKLSLLEMTAILAGCDIYVGASFHGAITAIVYGKKAVSFNYIHPYKNKEMFKMFGIEEYVIDSAEVMKSTVQKLLPQQTVATNVDKVINQVNQHFDKLMKFITNPSGTKLVAVDCESLLINLLPNAMKEFDLVRNLHGQLVDSLNKLEQTKSEEHRLIKLYETVTQDKEKLVQNVDSLMQCNERLRLDESRLLQDNDRLIQEISNFSDAYNHICDSFWWRVTYPARLTGSFIKKLLNYIIFKKNNNNK